MIKRESSGDAGIPGWVVNSIRSRLDSPGLLQNDQITYIENIDHFSDRRRSLAYANTGKYDGAFIIYEKNNGKYAEIFFRKVFLIDSVQLVNSDIIVSMLVEGGTGISTSKYYLIRYTPEGYKIVWTGLANHFRFFFDEKVSLEINTGVSFSSSGEIVHSVLKRTFTGDKPDYPLQVVKYADIYEYDGSLMKYKLSRRY